MFARTLRVYGFVCVLLAGLLLLGGAALAEEAQDITKECTFKTCYTHLKPEQMTDGQYTTAWKSKEILQPYVEVNMPAGIPCYGVYICFAKLPTEWSIETVSGGKWTTVATPTDGYYHDADISHLFKGVTSRHIRWVSFRMRFVNCFTGLPAVMREGFVRFGHGQYLFSRAGAEIRLQSGYAL